MVDVLICAIGRTVLAALWPLKLLFHVIADRKYLLSHHQQRLYVNMSWFAVTGWVNWAAAGVVALGCIIGACPLALLLVFAGIHVGCLLSVMSIVHDCHEQLAIVREDERP